ncbi:MAG: YidC/Oxa1 family membrane protein insertase [Oscillospiraceae bacterium]|nr:YidC/Oxa1 family membrane protein insertase [Oscillospiraceae bacterium]
MFAQIGYYICIPFAWLTRMFYSLTGSYGVAIILFTLVVKLVILPFQLKSKKSMMRMNRMQGKIKDIQTRFANNKERQQQEMADLYAREGINPMGGCLWSFIPLPILIALYYIIRTPLRYFMNLSETVIAEIRTLAESLGYVAATEGNAVAYEQIYLSKFIHEHWENFAGKFDGLLDVNYQFLGLDLAETASNVMGQFPHGGWAVWGLLLLPFIAAALQLVMSIASMKASSNTMNGSNKMMLYLFPLMTIWMGFMFPAALCLYWIVNSAFSAVQELLLNKVFAKALDREETEKEREKREKRAAKMMAQREQMMQQQAQQQGKKPQPSASKKKKSAESESKEKRSSTTEAGRVGNRPYARGRAYSESHYED